MQLREPTHVSFIDDRFVPRSPQRFVVAPAERRINNHTQRRAVGVVSIVERQVTCGIANVVAEHCVRPGQLPSDRSRVRVQQDFVSVEAMTVVGIVRTVNTIAVQLTGLGVG